MRPGRLIETVLPARMGKPFRWLIGSSWLTNLGDGIEVAAGPLLIASLTQDPALVALAAFLQRLPWLLFGLYAGVLADRTDRRGIVVVANLLRAVVLVALAATLIADQQSIGIVLVAMLLLGTGEVFADTASGTLLPMVIAKEDLGIGNARLMAGVVTQNQLIGPAVGAGLFAAGIALPFMTQALLVALGVVLVLRMRVPAIDASGAGAPRRARHPRGPALDVEPPAGAHAHAGDPHLQRHLGRGVVGAWCCTRRSASAWAPSGSAC